MHRAALAGIRLDQGLAARLDRCDIPGVAHLGNGSRTNLLGQTGSIRMCRSSPGRLVHDIHRTGLQRLQRFPEAIACYDMAIAKDGTMTMAYLYKGAVFNRLERYSEALECYEQALKSRQKKEQAANVIFDELD
jgi:tetratricopeptide (TPR) repeat protein